MGFCVAPPLDLGSTGRYGNGPQGYCKREDCVGYAHAALLMPHSTTFI